MEASEEIYGDGDAGASQGKRERESEQERPRETGRIEVLESQLEALVPGQLEVKNVEQGALQATRLRPQEHRGQGLRCVEGLSYEEMRARDYGVYLHADLERGGKHEAEVGRRSLGAASGCFGLIGKGSFNRTGQLR